MSIRRITGRAALLALAITVAGAAPAAAQRDRSFEISAFAGGYFGSQIYQGQPQLGTCPTCGVITASVGSDFLYGARLGYNFTRQFGMEFSWSASSPTVNFSGQGASFLKGNIDVNNFDFDAMFNFGQQRVWGYFALGLGWSSFGPNITENGSPSPVSSQTFFSGNTALGMKAFLTPHIALQFDARYRWSYTNHQTSSGVGCYYYCYGYSTNYYGAGELSGGITYVAFK
jgi:hypothetical protein